MPIESLTIEDHRLRTSLLGRDHVVYLVKICFTSSEVVVWRRFREFKRLHEGLRTAFAGHIMPSSFPSSEWSDVVVKRRKSLEEYLMDLLKNPQWIQSPTFLLFISNDRREYYPPPLPPASSSYSTVDRPESINPSTNVDLLTRIKGKIKIISVIGDRFSVLKGKFERENENISNISGVLSDFCSICSGDDSVDDHSNVIDKSTNIWETAMRKARPFSSLADIEIPKSGIREIEETFKIRERCRKKLLSKQTLEIDAYNSLMRECDGNERNDFDRAYRYNMSVLRYRKEREEAEAEFAIIENRLFDNLTRIEEEKEKIIKKMIDDLRAVVTECL